MFTFCGINNFLLYIGHGARSAFPGSSLEAPRSRFRIQRIRTPCLLKLNESTMQRPYLQIGWA